MNHLSETFSLGDSSPPLPEPRPQGQVSVSTLVGSGVVHAQVAVDTTSGSPLATLQTSSGRPIDAFSARSTDIVTIRGMQTTVANAVTLGILQRHPATGALVETGMTGEQLVGDAAADTPATQKATEEAPQQAAPLSKSASTFQSVLRDRVPGTELSGAYADYIERGTIPEMTVNRIASHLGITPTQALDNLAAFAEALDNQRARSLAALGIDDPEGFEEWAVQTKPELFKRAKALQLTHGSAEGYRGLAQTYFENLDTIDPERVLTADFGSGITARRTGGKVVLKVPGVGEVPYRVAVAQGIVTLR